MFGLGTQVGQLNRVGKVVFGRLKKLGIETVKDLIFYYPFRYDDFSRVVKIKDLQPGMLATVRGKIELLASRRSPYKKKILTEAFVTDGAGSIKAIWFNQPWIAKNLKIGDEVYLAGKVAGDLFDTYFNSPTYEKVSAFNINTARLVPVYPLTEGISQKQLRFLMKSAISCANEVEDYLPATVKQKENLSTLPTALKEIHFPTDAESLNRARARLGFDELFLIQLWAQVLKKALSRQTAPAIKFFQAETKDFVKKFGFQLTDDQKKSAWEILRDLQKTMPMNRILDGDVGSGKTVVALIAAYNAALNGEQTVLMAPTEILARQHFNTAIKFLDQSGIQYGLLTRAQIFFGREKIAKKDFLEKISRGEVKVIIGTHALIQKEVKFNNLGLVIIDEQHRFGVEQREALRRKNKKTPHFLSMTATPIPRTLALTLYGDLDLSVIREMPLGRKKIITKIVAPEKRQLAYNFINEQIKSGRQVFVVCPLIDPSDKLGVRSVTQEFKKLNEQIFPDLKIGLLHGRLKPAEKEEIAGAFNQNEIKILVATSLIEVGIDVPNATVMMIESAERFGLAQLHQFRGRVGRSEHQSFCFLFSDSGDLKTIERLQSLVDCHDGFALANKDLALRGAGEIYGYEQSGFANLKIADLNDLELIKKTRASAREFVENNRLEDFPLLKKKINELGFSEHLE